MTFLFLPLITARLNLSGLSRQICADRFAQPAKERLAPSRLRDGTAKPRTLSPLRRGRVFARTLPGKHGLGGEAVFSWKGPRKNQLRGEGVTRDISVAGAFIYTRMCPPVGATVDLEILLSQRQGNKGKNLQIKTTAKVIRVENSAGAEGFAATSQDFTLLFDGNSRNAFGISGTEE